MSVLIKGMDTVPENCVICDFLFTKRTLKGYECLCAALGKGLGYKNELPKDHRRDDCPLVLVPTPHGDLIDRIELVKDEHQHYEYMSDEFYVTVRDIELTPTIIEAEGEDNG